MANFDQKIHFLLNFKNDCFEKKFQQWEYFNNTNKLQIFFIGCGFMNLITFVDFFFFQNLKLQAAIFSILILFTVYLFLLKPSSMQISKILTLFFGFAQIWLYGTTLENYIQILLATCILNLCVLKGFIFQSFIVLNTFFVICFTSNIPLTYQAYFLLFFTSFLIVIIFYFQEKIKRRIYFENKLRINEFKHFEELMVEGFSQIGCSIVSFQKDQIQIDYQNNLFRKWIDGKNNFHDIIVEGYLNDKANFKDFIQIDEPSKGLQKIELRLGDFLMNLFSNLDESIQILNPNSQALFSKSQIDGKEINLKIMINECIWNKRKAIQLNFIELDVEEVKENIYQSSLKTIQMVAHELRSPLNCLTMLLQLMLDQIQNEDPQIIEYIRICQNSCVLMLNLIQDLLDYSMILNNRFTLNIVQFNLFTVTKEIKELFLYQCNTKNITFHLEEQLQDPHLISDSNRLKQILINLLSNSIKFTLSGGNIHLKVSDSIDVSNSIINSMKQLKELSTELTNLIFFQVSDDGVGVNENDSKKLFQMFSSFEKKKMNRNGIGLGLVISKQLVGQLGPQDKIHLESEQRKGSSFSFVIFRNITEKPKVIARKEEFQKEVLNCSSASLKEYQPLKFNNQVNHQRVLVICRNRNSSYYFKEIFCPFQKFEVFFTRSQNEGIQIVQDALRSYLHFDFIIICHELPKINGREIVQKLKQLKDFDLVRTESNRSKCQLLIANQQSDTLFDAECKMMGVAEVGNEQMLKRYLHQVICQ